jgi:hypothetical protein
MSQSFTAAELEAYLDEALPPVTMAEIEDALRGDERLMRRLAAVIDCRDAGVHSLGGIWRRHRLSCPTREQLGSFLLGILPKDAAAYVDFHLEVVGCRCCRANLDNLRQVQAESSGEVQARRRRYFQSSAGHLRRR